MRADDYFGGEWLDELPRLRRMLTRQGIPADDVDDVLQETAIRLYAAWERLFDGRPLRPLVSTIALNVARDYQRRAVHRPRLVEAVPDDLLVDNRDVDSAVLARLEVDRTARALSMLSDGHRRTVLDAVAEDLVAEQAGRTRAPASLRMARTRARRQLVAALELIAGVIAVIGVAVRRPLSSPAVSGAVAVGVGVMALSVAIVVHPGVAGGHQAPTSAAIPAAPSASTVDFSAPRPRVVGHLVMGSGGVWSASGTSRWWPWGDNPLLEAEALGHRQEVGTRASGEACRVTVLDRLVVSVRCQSPA